MGFRNTIKRFENKRLALNQKQTARLNKKRLKIKAEYERDKVKNKNRTEITKYENKLSGFKQNKKKKFGSRVMANLEKRSNNTKPNPIFSGTGGSANSIYTTTSGTNPYDFSGSTKKKAKKKRGKTITIRL